MGSNQGIFKSTDNGSNWLNCGLLGFQNVSTASCFTSNGAYIFAGTISMYANVYKTSDNGSNWYPCNLNKSLYSIYSKGNYVYAGTAGYGIYYSTNYGASWTLTDVNNRAIRSFASLGGNLYAASEAGVYMSSNNGVNWFQNALIDKNITSLCVIGNIVYAGTYQYGIYFTSNSGLTWNQTSFSSKTVKDMAVNGNNFYAATFDSGLYVSTNNGNSWNPTSLTNQLMLTLEFVNSALYVGTQTYGVFRTSNSGLNWEQISYINRDINCLYSSGNNIWAGKTDGLYKLEDNGVYWYNTGIYRTTYSVAQKDSILIVGTDTGIFCSTNSGASFAQNAYVNNISIYCLGVYGNVFLAGTLNNGVFRSVNSITNWVQTSLNNKSVYSLAISGTNIYAGTVDSGIYLSVNGGSSWTKTALNNRNVYSLAASGNNIFAGTTGYGVYLSTNNGLNWEQTSLNNKDVYSLVISGNNIFAGTDGYGIYLSKNNGMNWSQKNEGFYSISGKIRSLLIPNSYIFSGLNNVNSSYIWRRSLQEVIKISNLNTEVPENYKLMQNYPNPFNPTTSIKYQVASIKFIKLVVYDILGKEVAVLVNEKLQPGEYETQFPNNQYTNNQLPSGIYFYSLFADGERIDTKKMVLLK